MTFMSSPCDFRTKIEAIFPIKPKNVSTGMQIPQKEFLLIIFSEKRSNSRVYIYTVWLLKPKLKLNIHLNTCTVNCFRVYSLLASKNFLSPFL